MMPEMDQVKDAALKYDKPTLARMAQMGQMSPTIAVMAGMMRDRIVQSEMKPPNPPTVAEEIFAPPQAGLGAIAPQGMGQPQMAQAPQQGQGLDQIPVPEEMFSGAPAQGLAGGGIVAFSNGGMPMQSRLRLREMMTPQEQAVFDRSGAVPSRLQSVADQMAATDQQGLRAPVAMQGGRPVPVDASGQELKPTLPSTAELAVDAMPSANLAGINMQPLISRATELTTALRPGEMPKVPTVQEASTRTSDLLRESGYNEQALQQIRNDIKAQRESMAGDKREAMNLRLIEAGLGIMGGESPYAFANIGKGAAPALKGLSNDIKDMKKAERELRLAEQNLLLKQNESAMGKARITQGTIDKAQDRLDRQQETFDRTRADLTKTLLSGEVQERLARASFSSRMTDFDKQWAQYTKDAKARKEEPTLDGFRRALEGSRAVVTERQATQMALDALKNTVIDLSTAEGKRQFEELKRYFKQQGSAESSGTVPALPPGFVLQQ
jgi:hypothetical protein